MLIIYVCLVPASVVFNAFSIFVVITLWNMKSFNCRRSQMQSKLYLVVQYFSMSH